MHAPNDQYIDHRLCPVSSSAANKKAAERDGDGPLGLAKEIVLGVNRMQADMTTSLWRHYRNSAIDMTLHPSDHMHSNDPKKTLERRQYEYSFVGESAINAIAGALTLSSTKKVVRILDYASGAGRVARHIRAMFPDAELYFADLRYERAEFCASQFRGTAVRTDNDFGCDLPGNFDLIWVGSLFTHISYDRMKILFDILWQSLAKNGTLVATFHGNFVMNLSGLIKADRWERIKSEFSTSGFGYEDYGDPTLGNVGVSVSDFDHIYKLGGRHKDARLVCYSEVGWAGMQDVAAWCKL